MAIRQVSFGLAVAAVAVAAMARDALAFCPMCRTAIEGAAGAPEAAGGLSLAALVLMAPPVAIFAALFVMFYRLRHAGRHDAAPTDDADEGPGGAL